MLIFHPARFPLFLSGNIFNIPLINFPLIIPSNIHLQCLCNTKNEKKQHHEGNMALRIISILTLTRPRNVKYKYVILRHLGDMCLFTSALCASVNKSHVPSLPQNNLYKLGGSEALEHLNCCTKKCIYRG